MTKRNYGKICFGNIKDESGTLQIMGLKFPESENALITLKNSNLGDILGVTGQIARIESGEITLKIFKCVILAKCLKVLPDKHSKLVDEEMRYRQRYLDLIVNSEVMTIFRKRSQIISAIRNFMNQKNYLEVEVPILQPVAGGANARPFVTFYNSLHQNYYLRIATELHLKRLIVGGFEGVYEIGRIFRNEGLSPKHNPEFTSMEFYAAYQNLEFGYQFTEEL
jgi:lysyl-tRNA synthetase class 2